MKREYRKPTIEIVDIETTEVCLQAVSWRVKDENYDPSTDHGCIIEDQGEKYYKDNNEYDPWNSDNWNW